MAKQKSIQQQITIKPDIRKMLEDQSNDIGLSMSEYIERLILEKHYENLYSSSNNLGGDINE